MKRQNYSKEFKFQTVSLIVKGKHPVRFVSKQLEVHENTLYRGVSEYEKHGNSAFPGNGSSIKVPSFSEKLSLVYACIKKHLKGKVSIKRLCYYVGVSCSGYYVFLNRSVSNLEIENAVFGSENI
ncbi:transposase [Listeria sp. FSL L7-1517]|uniref:transposase n=1 Tax=Listeria immobilis TaxID=2713502 RepID=UPI00164DD875|nr:transposase [Listeria immobilis]MBC6297971.1 transposase [Listeria immobilis]